MVAKLPDMQMERIKLAFNVFETHDLVYLEPHDFGLQGFQLGEPVRQDLIAQLVEYGVVHKSVELTKNAIIVRRV